MQDRNSLNENSSYSALVYALTMALYYVLSFSVSLAFPNLFVDKPILYYTLAPLLSVIAIIISVIFYLRVKKENSLRIIGINKFKPIYLLPSITIFVGMMLGVGSINGLIANLIDKIGGVVYKANIPLTNVGQFILFTICYALLPAIFEEVFFRGVMLHGLKKVKKVYAVLITALCFALYHGSLTQLVYQFIYGVALAFLTLKAKSIIPSIIVHFLNNFIILLIEFLGVQINLLNPILITIGLLLLIFGLSFLFVYDKGDNEQTETESVKNFFLPFGVVVISVCLIICILSAVSL